jgi:phenylacetate-coenzyme A ligase PaaK-like adenylate-forming protein
VTAITSLDAWIREKIGIGPAVEGSAFIAALEAYQLGRLNETIAYARTNSPFYREHLASLPSAPLAGLSDIARIPFTVPSDISSNPYRFMAVRQDDVARIVTLRTSGSTGEAKRLFFTEDDLELTVDFFHRGMATMVHPGQKVAILLPAKMPDSVGDLLAHGLERLDVVSLRYGPVADPVDAADAIAAFGAHCLVGIPTQVLAVACSPTGGAIGKGRIESVLLSTDYAPAAIARRIGDVWGCRVFTHFGMTETGLGGGVECAALDGYHLREADLYFEVVDHATGRPCADGTVGEVVFTTLTRRGMPLIRYRTGDIAHLITDPCRCGTALRRMARVRGRWDGAVRLGADAVLTLPDMDEALFVLEGLLDYRATVAEEKGGRFRLHLDVQAAEGSLTEAQVLEALGGTDAIQKSIAAGRLYIQGVQVSAGRCWTTTGVAKRTIITASHFA